MKTNKNNFLKGAAIAAAILCAVQIVWLSVQSWNISGLGAENSEINWDKTILPIQLIVFLGRLILNNKDNLKAGTFSLSESMSLKEIVDVLEKGNNSCTGEYKITFKEGLNMRSIASVIAENTDNSIDDVYAVLNNKEYLKGLIDEYWFLSDSILNDNIYYSLEGYLYPNTYYFCDKDVEVEEIFESMLDEMEKQLKSVVRAKIT